MDPKLLGGHVTAITIKTATPVGKMDRRNVATSAARTVHGGVAN